jgi:hypothetical protein
VSTEGRWGKLGALALVGAVLLAAVRSFRSRGVRRALFAGTLAGVAAAAFSMAAAAPPQEGGGLLAGALFVGWFVVTHAVMAAAEGIAAAQILAKRRIRPARALRGAVYGALGGHLGAVLAFLLFLSSFRSILDKDPDAIFFLIGFAPFAPAGALLAILGTFYGDVALPERAAPTDLPG